MRGETNWKKTKRFVLASIALGLSKFLRNLWVVKKVLNVQLAAELFVPGALDMLMKVRAKREISWPLKKSWTIDIAGNAKLPLKGAEAAITGFVNVNTNSVIFVEKSGKKDMYASLLQIVAMRVSLVGLSAKFCTWSGIS